MSPSTKSIDDSTTRVLLLRHGETAAPDRFHGSESDVTLSARGHLQAVAAARLIRPLAPVAVYSSDLRRAQDTARPISEACQRPLELIEPLRERRMGALSGRDHAESWAVYEETKRHWIAGDVGFTHDGAESFADVRARAVPSLEELTERHRGKTIVVVTHGVVLRVILCSLLDGLGPESFGKIALDYVLIHVLEHCCSQWSLAAKLAPECPTDGGKW